MTLRGVLFNNDQIPLDKWKITIKQIIMWILIGDILRSFVIYVTSETFNVTF
jgi:hypothetical protein